MPGLVCAVGAVSGLLFIFRRQLAIIGQVSRDGRYEVCCKAASPVISSYDCMHSLLAVV